LKLGGGWGVIFRRHTPAVLPSGNSPGTHCTGGCVGRRAGLDTCGEENISCRHRVSNSEQSRFQRDAVPTTLLITVD
jgi:hypothetical protein